MAISVGLYVLILISVYVLFPRQSNNLYMQIVKRKQHVIVWFKRANTNYIEKWLVVPPSDKETKIRKGMYYLSEKYAVNKTENDRIDGKRPVFFVDENDNIPRTFEKNSPDEKIFRAILSQYNKPLVEFKHYEQTEIIFQAQEFQRALQVRVDEFLFNKKKDKIQTWLLVALIIMSIMALYEASVLSRTNTYLEYLTTHMNTTAP